MRTDETILVIDDEPQMRRLLGITLETQGYWVITALNGQLGAAAAASHSPALILLDLGLPDIDGQDLLISLREWYFKPIIILTVRSSEAEVITALDKGANDYLTKPFRSGELLARIRAALRSADQKEERLVIEAGPILLNIPDHIAMKSGEILRLTSTEFALLSLFVRYQGRVLTHGFILREIWGTGYQEQTQYLRVFVAQLRKKIEDDPSRPQLLLTESGIGYRLSGEHLGEGEGKRD